MNYSKESSFQFKISHRQYRPVETGTALMRVFPKATVLTIALTQYVLVTSKRGLVVVGTIATGKPRGNPHKYYL